MPNLAAIKRESSSSAVRPSQPIEPLRRTVRIQPARGPKVARDCETRRAFCPAQRCRQQVDESHQPCVRGQQDPPHLQRHIPAMSPDEHLGLLRRDVDTVLELQLHSYSDEAWTPVAEAFAEYGIGVLKAWLYTGQIYFQVTHNGYGRARRPIAGRLRRHPFHSQLGAADFGGPPAHPDGRRGRQPASTAAPRQAARRGSS
jgi:hypothetical protein